MSAHFESSPPSVEEKQSLLIDDENHDSVYRTEYEDLQAARVGRQTFWTQFLILFTILLLGFSAGFAVSQSMNSNTCPLQSNTYSPAQTAVSYSQQDIHPHGPATYFGHPTDEQTKAWETLLEPVMISGSYDELAEAGESPETAIELLEGGYLTSLGVYHDLHCLRRIRFFIHQDYYYPNMTAEQAVSEGKHVEHCLEALRVATMCTGNTGLWTFEWQAGKPKAQARTAAQRSCVDWSALDSWARERAVGFNPALKPRLDQ